MNRTDITDLLALLSKTPEAADHRLEACLTNRQTSRFDPNLHKVLQAWPPERLEAIFVHSAWPLWGLLRFCPTDAVAQYALDTIANMRPEQLGYEPWVRLDLRCLLPQMRTAARERLQQKSFPLRHVLLRVFVEDPSLEDVPMWLAQLSSPRAENVHLAICALANLGPENAMPLLQKAFSSKRWKVRQGVVHVLCLWAPAPEVLTFARQIENREPDHRVASLLSQVKGCKTEPKPWIALDAMLAKSFSRVEIYLDCERWYAKEPRSQPGTWAEEEAEAFWVFMLHKVMRYDSFAQLSLWFSLLETHRDHPLAQWMALAALPNETLEPDQHWQRLLEIFGESLWKTAAVFVQHRRHTHTSTLCQWILETNRMDTSLGWFLLQHGSVQQQEQASRWLAQQNQEVLPRLLQLLRAKKVAVRMAAAQTLRRMKVAQATEPLRQALQVERKANHQAILREAIEACDPIVNASTRPGYTYVPQQLPEIHAGLEALRALIHDPIWNHGKAWRIANLLHCLAQVGALEIAADYLQQINAATWRQWLGDVPWSLYQFPVLQSHFGQATFGKKRMVTTLHTALQEPYDSFLQGVSHIVEGRARTNLLSREDIASFARYVSIAWQWCQEHQFPTTALELRVEALHAHDFGPSTTALALHHGFGLTVERSSALCDRGAMHHGLKRARVKVPKLHALRDQYSMGRQTFLNLLPLISWPAV